ncbi:hypothetical protein OBBRIDRAFT_490170 [Obba rivulosa]|uniref:Uncharacterized protein n=1 Tax=Obba rivulosa TaxID=1052685 RepID=A0A8E2DMB4_9APHY|nr:hypothetical protein OBBRIDRAFT_490170 [Obba rivulosa]
MSLYRRSISIIHANDPSNFFGYHVFSEFLDMAPRTARCPYNEGYKYTYRDGERSSKHREGSHISKFHRPPTKGWYDGCPTIARRNSTTQEIACPCGQYSSQNAPSVRDHANRAHERDVPRTNGTYQFSLPSSEDILMGPTQSGDRHSPAASSISECTPQPPIEAKCSVDQPSLQPSRRSHCIDHVEASISLPGRGGATHMRPC